KLEHVSSDLTQPITVAAATARVNQSGSLELSGSLTPQPLAADLPAKLKGLDLVPLEPWLSAGGLRVAGGVLGAAGRLRLGAKEAWLQLDADASLDGFALHDASNTPILTWKKATGHGLTLGLTPDRLALRELDVQEAFAQVHIDRQGKLQLDLGP